MVINSARLQPQPRKDRLNSGQFQTRHSRLEDSVIAVSHFLQENWELFVCVRFVIPIPLCVKRILPVLECHSKHSEESPPSKKGLSRCPDRRDSLEGQAAQNEGLHFYYLNCHGLNCHEL